MSQVAPGLSLEQRRYFRDELRQARAAALLDAEGFEPIFLALERLGGLVAPQKKGFGAYRDSFLDIAREGKYGQLEACAPDVLSSLHGLYDSVRSGRNDAVHEGAQARHLVRHCIELALAIEDGLMAGQKRIADFMVRGPATVEPWQPVAFARQQMLVNSFSYLPIRWRESWDVISDKAIANFQSRSEKPAKALRNPIEQAVVSGELVLERGYCVSPDSLVQDVVGTATNVVLVVSEQGSLLGIATFFDFL